MSKKDTRNAEAPELLDPRSQDIAEDRRRELVWNSRKLNNKIRLLSHRAYGFHSAASLIATIYLCCAGITLPNLQLL